MNRGEAEHRENASAGNARRWWESRADVLALALLATVPLLYPKIPPLVDLFGHMGRYRVQLDLDTSPWLDRFYGFEWAAIGNLGVDLLIIPLTKLLPLELAVKLIVLFIPALTVAGFLWVAREVHKKVPPTALFALPFAYSHPFMFGFVNYALSIALAFLGFALWLRLARYGRVKLRALLFVPISIIVFFAHTFGWGVLGLLCFSAEAVRQHDRHVGSLPFSWWRGLRQWSWWLGWLRSGWWAGLHASVMALPALIMLAWRAETKGGATRGWFDWKFKWEWVESALRDRWEWFDKGSMAVVGLVLLFALASRRLSFSRNLLFTALVLLVGFILLPKTIFGSTYADMRLLPYVFAVALLAIRFRGDTHIPLARTLAVAGLAFFLVRIGGHTLSLAMAANDQQAKLEALEHVPMGARVASLVGNAECGKAWALPRNSHLGAMTIVRRHGFSNDQWVIEGVNLLKLEYHQAGWFRADSSQIVRAMHCRNRLGWRIDFALTKFPREHFDYLWTMDVPPYDPKLIAGMQPVWRGNGSVLYRVNP